MEIKYNDISVSAFLGAEQVSSDYLKSKEKITIDDIKLMRHFPLASEKGLDLVNIMIMSAICEYHDQLREKLLESGIDIGEMDFHSKEALNAYLASRSSAEEPSDKT